MLGASVCTQHRARGAAGHLAWLCTCMGACEVPACREPPSRESFAAGSACYGSGAGVALRLCSVAFHSGANGQLCLGSCRSPPFLHGFLLDLRGMMRHHGSPLVGCATILAHRGNSPGSLDAALCIAVLALAPLVVLRRTSAYK